MQAFFLLLSPHLAYRKRSLTNSRRLSQLQQNSNLLGLPSKQLACLSLVARFPRQEVDPVTMLLNCNGDGFGTTDSCGKSPPPITWPEQLNVKSPPIFPRKGGHSQPEISPCIFPTLYSLDPRDLRTLKQILDY